MSLGPFQLTGEVSVGAIAILIALLGGALTWHRRLSAMETKVNIMFTWWVRQMKDINGTDVKRFFGEGDKQ